MLKKDFWFDLPHELIAQEPADPRDSARLLCAARGSDELRHQIFHDLPDLLNAGDLLVVNDSKVLPARLVGEKAGTGAVSEILLLRQVKGDVWECLAKPGKRLKAGTEVVFGDGSLRAVIRETMEDGNKLVEFFYDTQTLYESEPVSDRLRQRAGKRRRSHRRPAFHSGTDGTPAPKRR